MALRLTLEPPSCLPEHATISIAFEVRERLDADRREHTWAVDPPYVKDYDAVPGNDPASWPGRFDVSRWLFIAARLDGRRVGGAVVAPHTPTPSVATLWEIRVAPAHRRSGVGRALLEAAEVYARQRGCRVMRVETQDINVAACQLYAKGGYALTQVRRGAYPEFPLEVQLMWQRDLSAQADPAPASTC